MYPPLGPNDKEGFQTVLLRKRHKYVASSQPVGIESSEKYGDPLAKIGLNFPSLPVRKVNACGIPPLRQLLTRFTARYLGRIRQR